MRMQFSMHMRDLRFAPKSLLHARAKVSIGRVASTDAEDLPVIYILKFI